jgi:AcrR family transcriptional regulator
MPRGQTTRSSIVEQSLALASEVGLGALTIGDLAARTGMSKSGLFAHFGSKESLQLQILNEARRRFVEMVAAPAFEQPRGLPRLHALFDNWLAWSRADFAPGGCLFIATASELDDRPGPLRDALVAMQREWLEAIATAARQAVEAGAIASTTDPEQFAYALYSIALAHHHFSRLLRDAGAEDRARRAWADLLARVSA